MRTSECGNAASKRPLSRSPLGAGASRSPLGAGASRSPLEGLATDGPWRETVEAFRGRHPRRRDRLEAYERLLEASVHLRVGADVLAGRHRPAPPVEAWLNKADGRKKRVFQYPAPDELLFRTVNRLLQPAAADAASPWAGRSSRAVGRGPRSAASWSTATSATRPPCASTYATTSTPST